MSPRRVIRQMRPTLDTFNFWVGVAYFGLVAVVIALYFVNQSTQRSLNRQARDEAAHSAEIVANAQSQYQQCVKSRPTLKRIDAFIDGQRVIAAALVTNSKANLAATATDDPLYKLRVRNLARLRRAEHASAVVKFPVPSLEQCRDLRTNLLTQR